MPFNIFWFRRDLRLHDNRGFYEALKSDLPVIPIFIFDTDILEELDRDDPRVGFIHQEVKAMKDHLQKSGKDLLCFYGRPIHIFKQLVNEFTISKVFFNRDYEPYALERDKEVRSFLEQHEIQMESYKDHVIFEADEVLKSDGNPYVVFTPYKRLWLRKIEENDSDFGCFPSQDYLDQCRDSQAVPMITLEAMDFKPSSITIPPRQVDGSVVRQYDQTRNFPYLENGTSRLGIHFRFGTISIREKAAKAAKLNATFLNELIWRDFYSQILTHFPHVVASSFRPKYDQIEWRNDESEFQAWCDGVTGFPLVDAGMRELNSTGFMHNRVRMLTASFLTKHLLIDWRWGEAYFAKKLLDFDLASNNGGWQWAAGCGTDAAPYFRIFNPTTQLDKFDKDRKYVERFIPEWGTKDYPNPIVDHAFARNRCLETYRRALS